MDVKVFLSILFLTTFLSSCDIVKRKYRAGFYVNSVANNHKQPRLTQEKNGESSGKNLQTGFVEKADKKQQIVTTRSTKEKWVTAKTEPKTFELRSKKISMRKKIVLKKTGAQTIKESKTGAKNKLKTCVKNRIRPYPHGCNPTPGESFLIALIAIIVGAFLLAVPPVPMSFEFSPKEWFKTAAIWTGWACGIILLFINVAAFWPLFFAILGFNILFLIVFYLIVNA